MAHRCLDAETKDSDEENVIRDSGGLSESDRETDTNSLVSVSSTLRVQLYKDGV